jgi:hypothetical protein
MPCRLKACLHANGLMGHPEPLALQAPGVISAESGSGMLRNGPQPASMALPQVSIAGPSDCGHFDLQGALEEVATPSSSVYAWSVARQVERGTSLPDLACSFSSAFRRFSVAFQIHHTGTGMYRA